MPSATRAERYRGSARGIIRPMIQPLRADEAFLADVRAADPAHLHLWWLGQSGFLLAWRGRHALLDPYLSDSLTRKYAGTDKPHERMTARVVDPARLDCVDVVSSSHAHTDHLDPDTLRPLLAARPDLEIVAPEAHRELVAERAGVDRGRPLGLDDGETTGAGGFAFTAVPAAHETIERDADGHMLHLGYAVRCGPFAVYHAGDTVPHERIGPRVRAVAAIDVALLPINGRAPERRVAGNLDGEESAALAHEVGARLAVPMHFEMFAFNTEPPDAFVAAATRLGQPHRVLRSGERLTLTA
jgi:L-ascorbate metabolism protein UlaG (beta-lactamase superfamily)